MTPGKVTLASGGNSRYKLEIFPRIWLKSDKPSLWQRFGYFVSGKTFIKLPPIETCKHKWVHKTKEHHRTGVLSKYKECDICEHEVDYE